MYDTIIVGGGIAGLTVATELAARGESVAVLERYKAWGGRVVTNRDPQYEIGAGRIHSSHKRVAALVKKFKLHTYPIGSRIRYRDATGKDAPNDFAALMDPIFRELRKLPPSVRAQHTLYDLVPSAYRPIFARFPYTAEVHMLRADIALDAFQHEMHSYGGFYGIVEGNDALTSHIAATTKAVLKNRHRVADIKQRPDGLFEVVGDRGKKASAKPFAYTARRVVIATCRCTMGTFSVLKGAEFLKHVGTSALMRIYAEFPKNPDGRVWFADLPNTVVDGPLRFVIPINPDSGLIMASYTDGDDTNVWRSLDDANLERTLHAELVKQFPDCAIPKPRWVKKHDWPSGCSYWLPGSYDLDATIQSAHNPFPGVYVCGESIARDQCWIESALESAERLLRLL